MFDLFTLINMVLQVLTIKNGRLDLPVHIDIQYTTEDITPEVPPAV